MADVKQAIDSVLVEEDSTLSVAIVNLRDGAGWTRLGVTSKNHPELIPTGFFDSHKVSRDQALVIAEQVYAKEYATPLHIADIADQALANALLSAGANMGTGTAAKLLQQAINHTMHVDVDGVIGPGTLSAVRMINPGSLLSTFIGEAKLHYVTLAVTNPADQKFLQGWLNRANRWAA